MTAKDAAWFPVVGSVVLVSLFVAIKYLGAYYVNLMLNFYFFFIGAAAVAACLSPFVAQVIRPVCVVISRLPRLPLFSCVTCTCTILCVGTLVVRLLCVREVARASLSWTSRRRCLCLVSA